MSTSMRVVDTGLKSARRNIALTRALSELHKAGRTADTLRLCLYRRSVLVGFSQHLDEVVNVDACRRRRVEIARRVTGGGAVYMSPGVLVWEVVADRRRFGASLDAVAQRVCSGIAVGLSRLGISARLRPAGDVEIEGRKVSGSSGAADGATIILQGTVLVDFDVAEMAAVLRLPAEITAGLGRIVTSLAERLPRAVSMDEIKAALLAGLAQQCECNFAPGALTAEERALADHLGDETEADPTDASSRMPSRVHAAKSAAAPRGLP